MTLSKEEPKSSKSPKPPLVGLVASVAAGGLMDEASAPPLLDGLVGTPKADEGEKLSSGKEKGSWLPNVSPKPLVFLSLAPKEPKASSAGGKAEDRAEDESGSGKAKSPPVSLKASLLSSDEGKAASGKPLVVGAESSAGKPKVSSKGESSNPCIEQKG